MPRTTAYARDTEAIDPERLYPLAAFMTASGISKTRLYLLRRQGVTLKTYAVGRRQFVEGRDGIEFVKRVASQPTDDATTSD